MNTKDHPETDDSPLLNPTQHQQYQQLIGMLNWLVQLGRFDIAFATSSMSRFTAAPREQHLTRVLKIWGYLKKTQTLRTHILSSPLHFENFSHKHIDNDVVKQMRQEYPDATEELDNRAPKQIYPEIPMTAFVDADHAHDLVTRRSITGLIIFLGKTQICFTPKRQTSISTSTYGAEFNALRTATEEIIALRYALRSMGVQVHSPTITFGDNRGVILNTTIPDSLLKKKHVAISYHRVREAVAAGIVWTVHIKSEHNFADLLTKALRRPQFKGFTSQLFY